MDGVYVLQGGAEFGGRMADVDRRALTLAGGPGVPVRIIPTAAAADQNHERAGANGVRWFQSLGATDVVSLPITDRASADDQTLADELAQARLIYLLGGFPGYLLQTLAITRCWQAVQQAAQQGAVVAGSSAGAMVLGSHLYDPQTRHVLPGMGAVAQTCIIPHHNTYGRSWAPYLAGHLPGVTLIGIDERTGLVREDGSWRVYGAGRATFYRAGIPTAYRSGTLIPPEDG